MGSWFERGLAHRTMFVEMRETNRDDFLAGTAFTHWWIRRMTSTFRPATHAAKLLAELWERERDASGWVALRNDVTCYVAWVTHHRGGTGDRASIELAAASTAKYLHALEAFAHDAAQIWDAWRTALANDSRGELDAVLAAARSAQAFHTAGTAGVLELMAASIATLSDAANRPQTTIEMAAAERSGLTIPASAPLMIHVLSPKGDDRALRFESIERITIGHHSDRDVTLNDQFVETHHATIQQLDGLWVVEDRRTSNGTFLFDQVLSVPDVWYCHAPLNERDLIVVGNTLLLVERAT
ncbi:MAG: FHA domain-containing protein [Kofleriaceae bacterium]